MEREQNIHEELKSMGSTLADMPRLMPFTMPAGYFAQLDGTITDLLKDINASDAVPDWGKILPYTVPQGYFEQAAHAFVSGVISDPELQQASKELPYTTPAAYFDDLPTQMLQSAKATDKKQVGVSWLRPVKWLAAAMLILGIGIGSYRIAMMQQMTGQDKTLSSLSNTDIHDYLQHALRVDVDKVVENEHIRDLKVDKKDIVLYLNETGWDQ